MKWWAILLILILLCTSVSAEIVILGIGESYVREGVNFTLAKIDKDYEKAVICVNNIKQIVEDNQVTYFGNLTEFKLQHIDRYEKTVKIDIEWVDGCGIYCACTGDCLNDNCKIEQHDMFGDLINEETKEENKSETIEELEVVSDKKSVDINLVLILGVIGSLIGIFLVWLFWFREMSF